jgi:hypothetical protein
MEKKTVASDSLLRELKIKQEILTQVLGNMSIIPAT